MNIHASRRSSFRNSRLDEGLRPFPPRGHRGEPGPASQRFQGQIALGSLAGQIEDRRVGFACLTKVSSSFEYSAFTVALKDLQSSSGGAKRSSPLHRVFGLRDFFEARVKLYRVQKTLRLGSSIACRFLCGSLKAIDCLWVVRVMPEKLRFSS